MSAEMGTFRVDIKIENPGRLGASVTVSGVLVDTGSELSWVPAEILESRGVSAYIRTPRGRDIYAACGQLAAKQEPNLVQIQTA